jgi:hypothetical protein
MNMRNQREQQQTKKTNTDIVQATQTMPNTRLSLCYCENSYNMSTTGSVYNLAESNDSPHLTKTLIHRFITPRLSVATISTTSCGAPQTCPQPQTCCLFISTDFTDFSFTSHMPPTDLFPDFPKINPKEARPTLSTESTSRQHKSSHVE